MTTTQEAIDHWQHMDDQDEGELVGLLMAYVSARNVKAESEKVMEVIAARLKPWLEKHPDDELVDGERGLRAFLQARSGSERYDVTSMPAPLVRRLHKARALTVDVKVIRALSGKDVLPEDVKPYRVPGEETTALRVEAIKNG